MQDTLQERAAALGFHIPQLLLPDQSILDSWPVIACDQHTAEPDYWEAVRRRVGNRPSALDLVLPEAWIGTEREEAHLRKIPTKAEAILSSGQLRTQKPGFALVSRGTPAGLRRGLLVSVDLERYSYDPRSGADIVATEETISSRLPLRIRVREHSPLELSHVLALVDDRAAPLRSLRYSGTPGLKTQLPEGGGNLEVRVLDSEAELERALSALSRIAEDARGAGRPLVLIGDGNHSLAAAREHWRAIRETAAPNDPRRYAMLELVSVHDPALPFEPIHRWIRDPEPEEVLAALKLRGSGSGSSGDNGTLIGLVSGAQTPEEADLLAPGTAVDLARAIEVLARERPEMRVDYLHGADALREVVLRRGGFGLRFPQIQRDSLFGTIADQGVLPRKMFSLGESDEKRYYVEGRLLRCVG